MNLIAYTRVSTTDQAQNGHGLDAQRAAITKAADHNGWEIVDWASDPGVSGKRIGPNLAQALDRCKRGDVDGIVVTKVDRISRSFVNFGTILERSLAEGWALMVLDPMLDLSSPFGRAMARIIATFAELEREQISERVRAGLAQSPKRLGGEPILDPELVAEIRAAKDSGLTYRAICDDLNQRRVSSARGGRWYPSSVRWVVEERKS